LARTWLPIRVDLAEGHGERYWPRPGRIFAAARSHSFEQLADATGDAFARWDRSHLQEFTLTGQTRLCQPGPDWEIEGEITQDYQRVKLSRLRTGPVEALGILPGKPLPYWGWGAFPASTAAGGTATTASHPSQRTPGSLIFHRFGLTGYPPANGRGPGSRHRSQASAHPGHHQPAPPRPCRRRCPCRSPRSVSLESDSVRSKPTSITPSSYYYGGSGMSCVGYLLTSLVIRSSLALMFSWTRLVCPGMSTSVPPGAGLVRPGHPGWGSG